MATITRSSTDTLPDTPAEVLAALRAEQDHRHASEVRSMVLAAHWVALHPVLDPTCPDACFQSPKTLAGVGSPAIDEFTIPDIATMLGLTCDAVGSYLTDVIELRYRLPQLWAGTLAGLVTAWRARRIAQTTVGLTRQAAGFVDEQTAWCANRVTPAQLERLVDHARARFMPDQLTKEVADAADYERDDDDDRPGTAEVQQVSAPAVDPDRSRVDSDHESDAQRQPGSAEHDHQPVGGAALVGADHVGSSLTG